MLWVGIGAAVVLLAVFLVVMFLVLPTVALGKIRDRLEARVAETVPVEQVVRKDLQAVSFGLASRGRSQWRGNGALVLTPTELRWLQAAPKGSDLAIPLAAITAVETTRSHLGKSQGVALLKVTFAGPDQPDRSDSMAWRSQDVPGWITTLRQALGEPRG